MWPASRVSLAIAAIWISSLVRRGARVFLTASACVCVCSCAIRMRREPPVLQPCVGNNASAAAARLIHLLDISCLLLLCGNDACLLCVPSGGVSSALVFALCLRLSHLLLLGNLGKLISENLLPLGELLGRGGECLLLTLCVSWPRQCIFASCLSVSVCVCRRDLLLHVACSSLNSLLEFACS